MSRERRRLFQEEESPAEPGRYGCPMLVRAREDRAAMPLPSMRCSLGWALHDDIDAARCRVTDAVSECWKQHPERTPMVALDGGEPGVVDQQDRLATTAQPVEAAGD